MGGGGWGWSDSPLLNLEKIDFENKKDIQSAPIILLQNSNVKEIL